MSFVIRPVTIAHTRTTLGPRPTKYPWLDLIVAGLGLGFPIVTEGEGAVDVKGFRTLAQKTGKGLGVKFSVGKDADGIWNAVFSGVREGFTLEGVQAEAQKRLDQRAALAGADEGGEEADEGGEVGEEA